MTTLNLDSKLAERQHQEVQRLLRCGHVPLETFQEQYQITFSELCVFGYMHEMEVFILSTTRIHLGPNGTRFIREVGYGGTTLFRSYYVRPNCAGAFAKEIHFKRHLKRMQDRGENLDFRSLGKLTVLYNRT